MSSEAVLIEPGVCVALDVPGPAEAARVLDELAGIVSLYKVGYEQFVACGPPAVKMVRDRGAQVFLDLKLHDIPNTVAAGVRAALQMEPALLTVHTLGGRAMLEAAVEAAAGSGTRLLGVTVLTSLDGDGLRALGIEHPVREQAQRLALLAAQSGVDGLVLSPLELDVLRPAVPDLVLVTPGVRPASSPSDDQSRTMTPAQAVEHGADVIVVGRPILDAPDRAAAADAIVREVCEAKAREVQ